MLIEEKALWDLTWNLQPLAFFLSLTKEKKRFFTVLRVVSELARFIVNSKVSLLVVVCYRTRRSSSFEMDSMGFKSSDCGTKYSCFDTL